MPSVIRRQSSGSVEIFWLDRELLLQRACEAARELVRCDPWVERVVLFGSVAEGRALPSSDVDLLIVVGGVPEPFLERGARFTDRFRDVGLGVDLFVYTREEVERGEIPLVRTALQRGVVLAERGG